MNNISSCNCRQSNKIFYIGSGISFTMSALSMVTNVSKVGSYIFMAMGGVFFVTSTIRECHQRRQLRTISSEIQLMEKISARIEIIVKKGIEDCPNDDLNNSEEPKYEKNESAFSLNSMHSLPDEILLMIFEKLPLADYFRMQRVCKKWKNILDDPVLIAKQTIKIQDYTKALREHALEIV